MPHPLLLLMPFICGLWGASWLCADKGKAQLAPLPAYEWGLPEGFPLPPNPVDNPMTAAKVELGRYLFYDKRLSRDQSLSCASCHQQSLSFSDGRTRAVGVEGHLHPRNSMSLANVAYSSVLNWSNPNSRDLENQMLTPLFGETPPEMGMSGQESTMIERLKHETSYRDKFKQAFPEEQEPINLYNVTRAIASFERSLISADSPYDRYIYSGDEEAISLEAKRGEALFFSERLECFHCHGGFNFSDATRHAGSAIVEFNFHNTGLYNLGKKGAYPADNTGLYELTGKAADMGRFRAPTLRNIAVTAPYMHDGSIPDLSGVIDHYAAGGRTITTGPYKGIGHDNPQKSGFVKGFGLNAQERLDLLAFLNSLTDQRFLTRSELSDPF